MYSLDAMLDELQAEMSDEGLRAPRGVRAPPRGGGGGHEDPHLGTERRRLLERLQQLRQRTGILSSVTREKQHL